MLGGFVVIGYNHKPGIGAVRLQQPYVADSSSRRIGPDSGHNGPVGAEFTGDPEQFALLLIFQAGCLGSRAERDEKMYSRLNLTPDKASVSFIIHFSIPERGGKGGSASFEFHFSLL